MTFHKLIAILLILSTSVVTLSAEGYYKLSTRLKTAYNLTVDLRLEEAKRLIDGEKKQFPDNLMSYYIEDYHDLLEVFITQDKAYYERIKGNRNTRLNVLSKGDPNSPYHLYVQAEVRMHWSLLKGLFGEQLSAIKDIKKAYKLFESNQAKFPEFKENLKGLGVIKTIFGSVPDNYQWAANALGLEGSLKDGIRDINNLLTYAKTNDFLFEQETLLLYSYMLLQMGNKELAWEMVSNPRLNPRRSLGVVLIQSTIAVYTGHCKEAITILENRPKDKRYYKLLHLDFFLAKAKVLRLDVDAKSSLIAYLQNPQGKQYIKATYLYLAWYELVNGNEIGYQTYSSKVTLEGSNETYEDSKALRELEEGKPNAKLLKIRMLFDGGYYLKAKNLINNISESELSTDAEVLEYTYRKGRIYHELKQYDMAISFYKKVIDKDATKRSYLVANSALEMGAIYEKKRNFQKAKEYYLLCLSFSPDRYKFTLHQHAKTALNRLK